RARNELPRTGVDGAGRNESGSSVDCRDSSERENCADGKTIGTSQSWTARRFDSSSGRPDFEHRGGSRCALCDEERGYPQTAGVIFPGAASVPASREFTESSSL